MRFLRTGLSSIPNSIKHNGMSWVNFHHLKNLSVQVNGNPGSDFALGSDLRHFRKRCSQAQD
jgi:hypothetical protein